MKATVEKQLEKKWINKINSLKNKLKRNTELVVMFKKNEQKREQIIRKYY